VPHLGAKPLQKVTRLDIEAWHTTLRNGGLSPRSIGHAHRVLSMALRDAERDGIVTKNVCKVQKAPKVPDAEMVIVQEGPASWPSCARPPGAGMRPPSWRCSPVCVWAKS
jgi:hypothetical protein